MSQGPEKGRVPRVNWVQTANPFQRVGRVPRVSQGPEKGQVQRVSQAATVLRVPRVSQAQEVSRL